MTHAPERVSALSKPGWQKQTMMAVRTWKKRGDRTSPLPPSVASVFLPSAFFTSALRLRGVPTPGFLATEFLSRRLEWFLAPLRRAVAIAPGAVEWPCAVAPESRPVRPAPGHRP